MSAIHQEKPVNHGCTSEDRKQLPLGQWWCSRPPCALCLNLNALQSVCVHFKRAINMAKRLASKNSLQVLSYSAAPDPSSAKKKNVNSFQPRLFCGKNFLVKHYWHTLTCISSIQGEESQFSFGDMVTLSPVDCPQCRITEAGGRCCKVEGHKATADPRSRWQWDIRPALICFASLVANQYH